MAPINRRLIFLYFKYIKILVKKVVLEDFLDTKTDVRGLILIDIKIDIKVCLFIKVSYNPNSIKLDLCLN